MSEAFKQTLAKFGEREQRRDERKKGELSERPRWSEENETFVCASCGTEEDLADAAARARVTLKACPPS